MKKQEEKKLLGRNTFSFFLFCDKLMRFRSKEMKLTHSSFIVIILITLSLFTSSCHSRASSFNIIDKPISFSRQRVALTKEYMKDRYKIKNSIKIKPQMIIVHWTAVPSFEKSFNALNREILHKGRTSLSSSSLNVSAHFLVDRKGRVFRLMPENWMARHCIGLNHLAIGIENVGGYEGAEDLTKEQLRANIELIKYLKKKYSSINYLIGHYEYLDFENTPLWKENADTHRSKKIDPGKKFMKALRRALKQYKFLPRK